jgi:hypothetical protein
VNDAADTITISCTATSNSTDAALRDRATHTGTQSSDTLTDGTTSKTFLATERTKLAGVATGATANDTDANLKARGNHTGSQLASTISDFAAAVALLVTTKLGLKNNADVDLTASTDAAVNYKILDDGTSSSGWPNRLSFGFTPSGGVFHLTGWFNEYGELRLTPGKNNTIPFRIFAAETAAVYATRSMTEAMIQLVDNRVDRVEKFNVYANGNLLTVGSLTGASLSVSGAVTAASVTASGAVAGSNIAQKTRCVPTGTTGFATEPDGTLWVEYTP